jgi:hypothetical protein
VNDQTPATSAAILLIDRVHADWSMMLPLADRPTFATYLLRRLEAAGYTLRPSRITSPHAGDDGCEGGTR